IRSAGLTNGQDAHVEVGPRARPRTLLRRRVVRRWAGEAEVGVRVDQSGDQIAGLENGRRLVRLAKRDPAVDDVEVAPRSLGQDDAAEVERRVLVHCYFLHSY